MPRPASRRRTVVRLAAALALSGLLAASGVPVAAAIEPADSANRLDEPIHDLALLEPGGPDGAPRLLTLSTRGEQPGIVRAAILQRDRAWSGPSTITVDLGADEVGALEPPWLIGLGPGRFALLAVAPEVDRTIVVGLRTDGGPGRSEVEETSRTVIPIAIDDAGAGDTDGDGSPELVLASARTVRIGPTCQGSDLFVLEGMTLRLERSLTVPALRLAGGVLGSWDDVPGEDLIAYAQPNCPAGPDMASELTMVGVRLTDGTVFADRPVASSPMPPWSPAALRFDVDGDGADELMALTSRGLAVVDPRRGWEAVGVATSLAVPLVALPVDGADGRRSVRVAWLEPTALGPGAIGMTVIRRDASDGTLRVSPVDVMASTGMDPDRWTLIETATLASAQSSRPPTAWVGGIADPACPDVLLPGAVLGCDGAEPRTGAAWFATRPVATLGEGQSRRLLVASGVGWDRERVIPDTPSPWAAAPSGWWRHGPSAPFVLAELRAADSAYFREFPTPRATIEHATAPDGSTAIPGFTGVRLLVTVSALAEDALDPDPAIDLMQALGSRLSRTAQAGVARVPVPPGVDAGRDGGSTRVALGDVTLLSGLLADRWSVTVVPINDWGEVGDPVAGSVIRDRVGPSLSVDVPFTSALWPFTASIDGAAEPRSVVRVRGVGEVPLGRRGDFTIQTPLAPWPQTLHVTATDASGNMTVREVSVVGGVDYRRFPWAVIGAAVLLALVAVSGMSGARWRRAPAATPAGSPARRVPAWVDDGPVAEIEDLPPGGGIGRS